jgi:hypothetical protein
MAMSDLTERLRKAAKDEEGWAIMDDAADELERLQSLASQIRTDWMPANIKLAAERQALQLDLRESDALRDRLAAILTATANALKGQPKPMQAHSWHDLSEVATRIITAHDNLLARIECGLSGIVLQAGNDENGLARVIVHCSREALSSGPNLIGKRVAMVVIE